MKKCIFLMIFVFASIVFMSCKSEKAKNPADIKNDPANEITEAENAKFDRIDPNLPEMDFNGRDFNIVHWFVGVWEFDDCDDIVVEELNGDVFNDAVFFRNKAVEEKYNVNIKLMRMDINEITNNVRKMISAGDDTYDLIYQRLHEVMPMISSGMFYNLSDVPYVNFDMPWWDKRSVEEWSLGGKVYIAASDISKTSYDTIGCILFNKQAVQDYAIENLYEVAAKGDWTFDYLTEVCKNKAQDLNGDGILNDSDFIPFVCIDLLTTILFNGTGGRFAEKDENDMPVCLFNTERNLGVCEAILNFMYDTQLCLNTDTVANYKGKMFENGQSIFTMAQMLSVRKLREMEIDFGVLPSPKYDKRQENYYSCLSIHQAGLVSVPTTASDPDRTGLILEALSAESRYTVHPAYYEISLKGKHVRDDESADMLDILFNTRLYDLGSVGHFGGFETEWLRIQSNKKRDIVSIYEKSEKKIQSDIDKLIKAIEKLD
jgi:hypothetical protein